MGKAQKPPAGLRGAQVLAQEETQKYKEGKYILERARMLDLYEGNFASSTDVAALSLDACE